MGEPRLAGILRRSGQGTRRGAAWPDAAFDTLFEAAAEGYALLDADGRLLRANAALARMAGAAVPLTPGLAVEHLVAAAARPAMRTLQVAAAQGHAPPILATPAD
ncbi:MAG: PAS domain-containing protein, partial [Acetobacteraceae bacterium]|nr:PAS domain-containing protein [Acetobacteraceae bacterium]